MYCRMIQGELNAGQKYCRMLRGEHSAILSTFIKLSFVIRIFILSIFEWPLYTSFTLYILKLCTNILFNAYLLGKGAYPLGKGK